MFPTRAPMVAPVMKFPLALNASVHQAGRVPLVLKVSECVVTFLTQSLSIYTAPV